MKRLKDRRIFLWQDFSTRPPTLRERHIRNSAWKKMGAHERSIWGVRDSVANANIERAALDAARERSWDD